MKLDDLFRQGSSGPQATAQSPDATGVADGSGPEAGGEISATVTTLSDVTPERVSWLWPGYLPFGKLAVLDGDPSVGKSTLSTDLAARCSTGSRWPDGAANPAAAGVLLLSAEDGLADTIAPRLKAAGADTTRVHALVEVPSRGDDDTVRMVPPSLPRDIPLIESVIRKHRIGLVIVDVLMAYLNGKVDSHRDQDVRGVLHQLAAMADRTGASIILIRHLNKAGGNNALYRGGGSIGIIGAARSAFIVGRDGENPERRLFACSKMNIAAEPATLAYRLVDSPEWGCARIEWEDGPVEGVTATDLVRAPDDDERGDQSEAEQWLVEYLTERGGEAAAGEVFKAAHAEHIAERTLKRVRNRVGITSERRGFGQGSVWVLPSTGPNGPNGLNGSDKAKYSPDSGPNGGPFGTAGLNGVTRENTDSQPHSGHSGHSGHESEPHDPNGEPADPCPNCGCSLTLRAGTQRCAWQHKQAQAEAKKEAGR